MAINGGHVSGEPGHIEDHNLIDAAIAALQAAPGGTSATDASLLTSGTLAPARIADGSLSLAKLATTGTPSATTVLYGDGVYRTPAGGAATTDASQLTTGILPPARIGDASITTGKLAFDPATQVEVDTLKATLVGIVNHGAVASTARPAGYGSIQWIGSVSPANAVDGDTWVNTA